MRTSPTALATLTIGDTALPVLGQGTWQMGEVGDRAVVETEAIRFGVDQGLAIVDTAEMYGDGGTECFLATALAGRRDAVFLVSKVYPHNAGGTALRRACEGSLRRLGTDRLDLYLLHWRGRVPLAETVEGMRRLRQEGKIKDWGVSNFDLDDMRELEVAEGGAGDCACNQVLYNLTRRGPEFDLLPWMRRRGMPLMAYSPLEQGRLDHPGLTALAAEVAVTPLQLALAWVLHQPGVAAIPKVAHRSHVEANLTAATLPLTDKARGTLDVIFPPPSRKLPLEML